MDRASWLTATAVLALVAASCGSEDAELTDRGQNEPVGSTSESSPFLVDRPPDGYRLVQAGRGTISQTWSSDSFGDDEPVTVLAPAGEGPGAPDEVRVSLTGFEGYQGGLAQASRGYLSDDRQDFQLDGRPAIYMPAHERRSQKEPADLVVEAGDDLAIRVSSEDGTRDELADIAREVRPQDDHLLAPLVPEPPGDLEVVGSADADVGTSMVGPPEPSSEHISAGRRAHSTVWARTQESGAWTVEGGTVTVTTLPGQALDLDAAEASLHRTHDPGELEVTGVDVDGRPGVALDQVDDSAWIHGLRAVVTATSGGDLLLVVAQGQDPPDVDELIDVAASVEPTDQESWEDLALEARDGPGLHPDPGG